MAITKANRWTDEQIVYLKNNYTGTNLKELAKYFGRLESNICRKARELGLTLLGRPSSNRSKASKERAEREKENGVFQERNKKTSETLKQYFQTHDHPRGFLGKTHNTETRKIISQNTTRAWADPKSKMGTDEHLDKTSITLSKVVTDRIKNKPESVRSRGAAGTREDLGIYVRSSWEANYARYLNFLQNNGAIHRWEYEVDTFWFDNIKRGCRSYTPDFKVWVTEETIEYHEVKGWMDQKSRTKLKRMTKYYPNVKIILIDKEVYREIKKWSRLISNWE